MLGRPLYRHQPRGYHVSYLRGSAQTVEIQASGSIRPTMEFGTVSDGITNFTLDPSEPGNGDNIASGKNGQTLFGCQ
jgi:hypothetical protein